MTHFDRPMLILIAVMFGVLLLASIIGLLLRVFVKDASRKRGIDNLKSRVAAWWVMVALFVLSLWFGKVGVTILFALISFLALRETISLTPTRRADHHTLFWAFFVMIPLQYWLVYIGWYGLYSIFIPVYGFLFLAIRSTLTGDFANYLERTAKIHWGSMICIYCISHAPALLTLELKSPGHESWKLLVFLVVTVQASDVLQYVWGKMLGRHKIAPHISPNKTWEGFIGGVCSAVLLGVILRWLTPFTAANAALLSLTIALLGFCGGIVMSAIKRDAGVKDWSQLIAGHGGMMDRVDSLSFAAPVFIHLVRYWYT